jgi:cell shape-determining protein MreD
MAIIYKNFRASVVNLLPLLILYYLSISEIDTHFSNMFEILSFNLQIIIIYYWMLKNSSVLGNGHIFFAGILNDVVMGLPLGISSISYLTVSLVASYIRQVTVNISLFTDWFTFLLAIFFSNLVYLVLILNFTNLQISYVDVSYNAFFTFLFYPFIWTIFNFYQRIMILRNDD